MGKKNTKNILEWKKKKENIFDTPEYIISNISILLVYSNIISNICKINSDKFII